MAQLAQLLGATVSPDMQAMKQATDQLRQGELRPGCASMGGLSTPQNPHFWKTVSRNVGSGSLALLHLRVPSGSPATQGISF